MSKVADGWVIQAVKEKSCISVQTPDGKIFELSEDDAATMVSAMGMAKAEISTRVPVNMDGLEVAVIEHPTWYTWYEHSKKVSIFSFYHPAFGPVGYAFPMHIANELQTLWQRQCFVYLDTKREPDGK